MRGYTEREIMPPHAIAIWRRAIALVDAIATPDNVDTIRCHELARAVGKVLGLWVTDGKYGVMEHSWCLVERKPADQIDRRYAVCPFGIQGDPARFIILDVYAAARLPMVQLVNPHYGFHDTQYRSMQQRYANDIDEAVVERLVAEMRGTTIAACHGATP